MVPKKTERRFYSISQIEKRYFPKYSESMQEKKITDPEVMGVTIARSSLARIKNLIIS